MNKTATMRIDLVPEISDVPLSKGPKAIRIARPGAPKAASRPPAPAAAIPTAAAQPAGLPSAAAPAAAAAPATLSGAAPAAPEAQAPADSYAALFQNIYDAAIVTDLHGRVRDVNRRATTAFGYTPAQFSHLTIDRLVAGADTDLLRTLYENLRRETYTLMQAFCTRADGTSFPAEVSVSQLRLSTPHLCFLVRDETVRRQTDEMLRTEHNALQNASDAIVVIDLQTRIEYANPATARIWGYASAVDLVGQPLGALLLNAADGAAVIESLSGENYESSGVAIARRSDGEAFRIEIHASCNRDSDGNVIGAVLSLSDLTERDRVRVAEQNAETLRAAFARLHDTYHALGIAFGDLDAQLQGLAASSEPAAAARIENALGVVAGIRSLTADVDEIFHSALETAPAEGGARP